MPIILDDTHSNSSVRLSYQRKIFRRKGITYLFWADKIDGVKTLFYRMAGAITDLRTAETRRVTSPENAGSQYGNQYDVHYDRDHDRIGMAWCREVAGDKTILLFKYGIFEPDGSIDWRPAHRVDEQAYTEFRDPVLGRSAIGRWGIFLKRYDGNRYEAPFYACGSATPAGSGDWTDQGNIPGKNLKDAYRSHRICQLGNSGNEMLLIYKKDKDLAARRWNGSAVEAELRVAVDIESQIISGPVTDTLGNVHILCFNDKGSYLIKHAVYQSGTKQWGKDIASFPSPAGKYTQNLALQIDDNDDLHLFFKFNSTNQMPEKIHYFLRKEGLWCNQTDSLSGDLAGSYRDLRETPTTALFGTGWVLVAWVNETSAEKNELWVDGIPVSTPAIAPTADFAAEPNSGDVPLTVNFSDRSQKGTDEITAWKWEFGDGNSSTEQNPSHEYQAPGTFTVKLTVSDGTLSHAKTAQNLIVANAVSPVADFAAEPNSGDVPLTVNFSDRSQKGTNEITAWKWEFGDGNSSTVQNPSHEYQAPGTFTVKLTVSDGTLSHAKTAQNLIVADAVAPTADFAAEPKSGDVPLTVQFTDRSQKGTNDITAWKWDFGDGNSSTEQNPTHEYQAPGTFTVKLTVSDGTLSHTKTAQNLIVADAIAPTADFAAEPNSGDVPLTVQFSDRSQKGTNEITEWKWEFGDGNSSTGQNPVHEYQAPGTFTVKLTVSDGTLSHAKTAQNLIEAKAIAPTADFAAEPTSGSVPLQVQFTDRSQKGSSDIVSWLWDLGDGNKSHKKNPQHIYGAPGNYSVKLTVSDGSLSDIKTADRFIATVAVPPTADFAGTPSDGFAPLTVQFRDQSSPGTHPISNHQWDFGDGQESTTLHPVHTYNTIGTHTVRLTVSDGELAHSKEASAYINVIDPLEECRDGRIKGMLSYLFFWISGLFFWRFDKNKCVRFHGLQSFITFLGICVIVLILDAGGLLQPVHFGIIGIFTGLLWLFLMLKALQGTRFKLPVIGDFAEKQIWSD